MPNSRNLGLYPRPFVVLLSVTNAKVSPLIANRSFLHFYSARFLGFAHHSHLDFEFPRVTVGLDASTRSSCQGGCQAIRVAALMERALPGRRARFLAV
jgi:hypothetical protein